MHALEGDGNERAGQVSRLLDEPERIIGTVLLGNNLVNILASALTTSILIRLAGEAGVFYATFILTLLVVIFCEVLAEDLRDHRARPLRDVHRADHAGAHHGAAAGDRGGGPRRAQHPVADAQSLGRRCQHPGRTRTARHHRVVDQGRHRRQGRGTAPWRRARSQGAAARRHHGSPHRDGDHRHCRRPAQDRRRRHQEPVHAHADLGG